MIAVFGTGELLNSVLPLPSGVQIGIPLESLDGRVAICHSFSEEDLTVLTYASATITETLPEDWQYPTE